MHRFRSKARVLADFFGRLSRTFEAATLNNLEGLTVDADELNKTAKLKDVDTASVAGETVVLATKLSTGTQESITKLGVVADAEFSGSLEAQNSIFTGSTEIRGGVVETQGSSTVSGTTVTADLDTGNFFEFDLEGLSGDVATFTISNTNADSNRVSCFITKIIQGSTTTTRNFSWSTIVGNGTNIDWAGGSGPDITTGADKVDILSFTTYDNGTTWYGAPVGQEFY